MKKIEKIIDLRFLQSVNKKHKGLVYNWNPGLLDSEGGSESILPWIFGPSIIISQSLQSPSGSLLIIILAATNRSRMTLWFSQHAWVLWCFLTQAFLYPAADSFLPSGAEWFQKSPWELLATASADVSN